MTKGKSAGNSDGEYEIGYGKPPLGTRFQRGRSGNPRGRPRRPRSFDDEFWKMLGQPVTVAEGGRKKRVTTLDAALMRMREKRSRATLGRWICCFVIPRAPPLASVLGIDPRSKPSGIGN